MNKNSTGNNIKIYNRQTKSIEEEVIFQEKYMKFFLQNTFGKFLSKRVLIKKWVSYLYGLYCESILSRHKIKNSIKNYNFNINEIEQPITEFKNFNEFFTRKLKNSYRPVDTKENILIAPSDSRLCVSDIKDDLTLDIKGFNYTIKTLIKDKSISSSFKGGLCLVFRLAPIDYHRYIYIDNGFHETIVNIDGKYNSVHPLSLKLNNNVFLENKRSYCILNTENFNEVLYMEVGAMLVGEICNHFPNGTDFKKGIEKGFFKFGGSTLILLFKPNTIILDQDIIQNSKNGIETKVQCGSKIGTKFDP